MYDGDLMGNWTSRRKVLDLRVRPMVATANSRPLESRNAAGAAAPTLPAR